MKTEGPSNQYRAHRSSVGIVFTTSNRDLYVNYALEKDVSSNCIWSDASLSKGWGFRIKNGRISTFRASSETNYDILL
jgi:hypothetical protein